MDSYSLRAEWLRPAHAIRRFADNMSHAKGDDQKPSENRPSGSGRVRFDRENPQHSFDCKIRRDGGQTVGWRLAEEPRASLTVISPLYPAGFRPVAIPVEEPV